MQPHVDAGSTLVVQGKWAVGASLSALVAVLCLHFTVSLLLGVAGAGRYEGAVGATMFFAVYATPITLIGGTPVALVLTGLWIVLAIRGVVSDASRRALALAALIGGATAPLLFWWIHGAEHMREPYAGSTTLLLWTAATIGLLAPRLLSASLAPGRFTTRPAGASTRD